MSNDVCSLTVLLLVHATVWCAGIPTDVPSSIPLYGKMHRATSAKLVWHQSWITGTVKRRRIVKCLCCGFFLVFLAVIIVASLAMYFSISCTQLSHYTEPRSYIDVGSTVTVTTTYPRGDLQVGGWRMAWLFPGAVAGHAPLPGS